MSMQQTIGAPTLAPTMRNPLARYAPWLVWPAIMTFATGFYFVLLDAGVAPAPGAMIPILLTALLVVALERFLPHRPEWQASPSEMRADLLFMLAVQLAWPRAFGAIVVLAVVEPANRLLPALSGVWPREWPFVAQFLMLLLAADVLRYWLHRAAHTWPWLWRLHAVHHSPERLYWLNVGRFHPLEKSLQMFAESIPFALLGAGEEIIALLFVISAANGFLKHSNIELRHGALNYLVSNAEHHRWHHSRRPEESNRNYGDNLIVWDLLFRSWHLPTGRSVGELGLTDRRYPAGFGAQLLAPFVPDRARRWPSAAARKAYSLAAALMAAVTRWRELRPLLKAAERPRAEQERTLLRIVQANRDTSYGRRHGFTEIRSIEDFTRRVPIVEYEALRPYVEEQATTGNRALTRATPRLYTLTSGTTAKPKQLPVVAEALGHLREGQRLHFSLLQGWCPSFTVGTTLALVGPAVEYCLPQGQPVGTMSGVLYAAIPRCMRQRSVIPVEVFDIGDHELKYRLILRIALAKRDIVHLAAPNPSTLLRLLEIFDAEREAFANDIERGEFEHMERLDSKVCSSVQPLLSADPARAAEIRALDTAPARYGDLWPGIALVSTWTGGSCAMALDTLRTRLPANTRIVDLGYTASEVRGTVTFDPDTGAGLPLLHQTFYEFVERDAWDRGDRRTQTLEALKHGREYHVIVTTVSGLYRYFMNDIVRVEGFHRGTPLLKFVQKGRGVTNITGEKLYEGQVIEAMDAVRRSLALESPFYIVLADERRSGYVCHLEAGAVDRMTADAVAGALDRELSSRNLEYRDKRASGRIKPPLVRILRHGTGNAFHEARIASGQRESQYKPVALAYARECAFDFTPYVETVSCA